MDHQVLCFGWDEKSLGKCNVVPYTSSAIVHLRMVRIPNSTIGREQIQLVGLGCEQFGDIQSIIHTLVD